MKVIRELQPDFSCNKMPVAHYSCTVLLLLSHIYVLELGKGFLKTHNVLFHKNRLINFSNRTGMSVDNSMHKPNNWLDQLRRGKLGTRS